MRIVGKRDLARAASQSAQQRGEWKQLLHRIIETELRATP